VTLLLDELPVKADERLSVELLTARSSWGKNIRNSQIPALFIRYGFGLNGHTKLFAQG